MSNEDRLMRYAKAIAQDDLDVTLGPGHELPDADHAFWNLWRRTATLAMNIADQELAELRQQLGHHKE